jgi:hypothetical protein
LNIDLLSFGNSNRMRSKISNQPIEEKITQNKLYFKSGRLKNYDLLEEMSLLAINGKLESQNSIKNAAIPPVLVTTISGFTSATKD